MVACWLHIVTQIWVNIGTDSCQLPEDTYPLFEPMLTYHKKGYVEFTQTNFAMSVYQHDISHVIGYYTF